MPNCQNLANSNWICKMADPIKLCPDPHIRHKLVSRALALKMAAKFDSIAKTARTNLRQKTSSCKKRTHKPFLKINIYL